MIRTGPQKRYRGFYHAPRYGRPALALDLMEPFRAIIADSVVLSAVNTGEVGQTYSAACIAPRMTVRKSSIAASLPSRSMCQKVQPLQAGRPCASAPIL